MRTEQCSMHMVDGYTRYCILVLGGPKLGAAVAAEGLKLSARMSIAVSRTDRCGVRGQGRRSFPGVMVWTDWRPLDK